MKKRLAVRVGQMMQVIVPIMDRGLVSIWADWEESGGAE